jgi:hypothetical protein
MRGDQGRLGLAGARQILDDDERLAAGLERVAHPGLQGRRLDRRVGSRMKCLAETEFARNRRSPNARAFHRTGGSLARYGPVLG